MTELGQGVGVRAHYPIKVYVAVNLENTLGTFASFLPLFNHSEWEKTELFWFVHLKSIKDRKGLSELTANNFKEKQYNS